MNDKDLHTLLTKLKKAQPSLPRNKAYVKAMLMNQYEQQQTSRHPLRTFTKQLIEGKNMKVSFASPLAILVSVVVLTASASAAAYWFNTQVTSSKNGSIITVSAKDCPSIPASQAKMVGATLPSVYTFDEKYQIVDSSRISQTQIEQAAGAMCEQRAVAAQINSAFPDMQEFSATKLAPNSKGLYFPIYLSGTVALVQGNKITITNLDSNPGGASSATMELADNALLTKGGQKMASLQPGDVIYFAYQNQAVPGEIPNQDDAASLSKTTDPGYHSVIRGAGIMTTDAAAIKTLRDALHSGAVKQLASDSLKG